MSARSLVQLGTCLSRVSTWNPLRESADDVFRYIDLSSVDQDTKSISDAREVACGEAPSRARQLVTAGDVLVSTVRPNLNGVARVPSDLDGATASTGFCVLRPELKKIDGSYLFQWVKSSAFISDMVSKATGASYPAVSDRIIFESSIPLPPLEEQRRIAAILDQAETLRTQRRQALAHLDTLTQSLFLDMFGDPVANPKGWPVVALTDVCHCYSGGTPSKANGAFWEGRLPWFSAKDMKAEDLFDSEDHIAETVPQTSTLKLLPKDTVAIVVRGMILAHTFPICVLRVPATINQDLKALIPTQPINAQFLAACLRSQSGFVLEQVSEAGHGTKRLDAQGLQKIRVLRPGSELEQTFATRIQAIESLKATHRAALVELDALFASLQQRAFAGML